ncbi:hypothetical protein BJ741DRAFT_635152 [Chytriomyces cf. hyalinus JEL632]|nr:hypothetical protein BJ741DRAFT_635152 [Chytriomyces cf. hyalinus JEL632]
MNTYTHHAILPKPSPNHTFLATAHTLLSSNKYGKGVTRPVTAWLNNAVQLPEPSPSTTTAKLERALLQALHSASSYDPQLRHVYSLAVLLFESPDSLAPPELLQEDANDFSSSIISNQEPIDTNDIDDQHVDTLVSLTIDQLHHVSLSVIDSGLFGKGVTAPLKAFAAITVAAPNAEKLESRARYVLYAASSYSKDLRSFISSAAASVAVAHPTEPKRFTKTTATTTKTVTSHNESGQRVIKTVITTKTTFSPL